MKRAGGPVMNGVRHVLHDTPGVKSTATEIAGELSFKLKDVAACLHKLHKRGQVQRIGAGGQHDPYRYWVEP